MVLLVPAQLRRYYREHDDFRRYSIADEARVDEISRLYTRYRRYFGRRVLDLACGGAILGFILAKSDHRYVGVDKNLDMVKEAMLQRRKLKSRVRILHGDIKTTKFEGVFDTVTLLGNAVIHFNQSELRSILQNAASNVREGSYFLVEYRDVVSMLFNGDWNKRFVDTHGETTTTSISRRLDRDRGEIEIDSLVEDHPVLKFTHAVWSPFIMVAVLEGLGWSLVTRERGEMKYVWTDVYVKRATKR